MSGGWIYERIFLGFAQSNVTEVERNEGLG